MSKSTNESGPIMFVYGYYGCGNLGDELLLSAVVSGILARRPGSRFRVRNLGPIAPDPRLLPRIETTGIERHLLTPGRNRILRGFSYLRAANRAMQGCSHFVLGGGTLIHAKSGPASLALLTILIAVARLRGQTVLGLGLGAADLQGWLPRALAYLAKAMMHDIAVRDEPSQKLLPSRNRARLTSDLVYGWWPDQPLPPRAAVTTAPVVAVTIWSVVPHNEPVLLRAMADALEALARTGHVLRFLVFQDGNEMSGGLSDRPAFERLVALLQPRGIAAELVHPTSDPADIAAAYSGAVVHCGTRFHGCVLASLLGIPSVGLASDPKVSSLCQEFGMPFVGMHDVKRDRLLEAIAMAKRTTVSQTKISELRARCAANFAWLDAHDPA